MPLHLCVSCVLVGLVTCAPSPVFSWVGYSCPFTCVSCVLVGLVTRAPSVLCQLHSLALRYRSNLFLLCSACGRGTSDAEVKASAVKGLKQSSAPSFLCGRSDLVFCCCLCFTFCWKSVFLTNHKTSQLIPLYFFVPSAILFCVTVNSQSDYWLIWLSFFLFFFPVLSFFPLFVLF